MRIAPDYFNWALDFDDFTNAVGAKNCVLFIAWAGDAGKMSSLDFAKLEGYADGAGGNVERRDAVVGAELA